MDRIWRNNLNKFEIHFRSRNGSVQFLFNDLKYQEKIKVYKLGTDLNEKKRVGDMLGIDADIGNIKKSQNCHKNQWNPWLVVKSFPSK